MKGISAARQALKEKMGVVLSGRRFGKEQRVSVAAPRWGDAGAAVAGDGAGVGAEGSVQVQ